jgi:hypothetical protein
VVEVSSTASTRRPETLGALDPPLQPVRLALLAHHEGVQPSPLGRGSVQHGGGDRVRAEREPSHSLDLEVGHQVEHHPADQGSRVGGQRDATQIDVVVGLTPRRQRHAATDHRVVPRSAGAATHGRLAGQRRAGWLTAG